MEGRNEGLLREARGTSADPEKAPAPWRKGGPSAGKPLSPLPSCLLPTHRSSPTRVCTDPRLPSRPRAEVRRGLARAEQIPSFCQGAANSGCEVSRFLATSES